MTDGPIAAPAFPVRRRHWLGLVVILLLAAGLRVHGLSANSFWIDEFYSLEGSAGKYHEGFTLPRGQVLDAPPRLTHLAGGSGVAGVWTSLRDETHPPLYYLSLRVWREIFGSSDAAVRAPSVVASLLTILLLFDLARLLVGPGPALWACLVLAVSQTQIWYAQEARSYALLTAALLGSAAALVRIEVYGFTARRGIGLGAGLLATMLTHYFGVAGCAAIGVYAVARLGKADRGRTVAVMAAAAVVYAVIWGPFFVQQTYRLPSWSNWLGDAGPGFAARWVHRVATAPYRVIFGPVGPRLEATPWPALQWMIPVLPFLFPGRRRGLLLPLACAAAVLVLPAALDVAHRTQMLQFDRYFVAAAPYLCLIAAGVPAVGRVRVLPHVLPAAMVLLSLTSLPWVYMTHNLDWRYVGTSVTKRVGAGDVIVYHSPGFGDWYAGVLYLAVDHYAPDNRARALFLNAPASPDVVAALRAAPKVWLLSEGGGDELAGVLPGFTPGRADFAYGVGFLTELHPVTPGVANGH